MRPTLLGLFFFPAILSPNPHYHVMRNVSRDATRRPAAVIGRFPRFPSTVHRPPNLTLCTMSTLNRLAIRGSRSFDDKNLSVIEFYSPVTVIVGHNGSGKTTIIECLKYATTGDQPPGSRGGAFVHDPKMANEKEVKAEVKLRFFAENGQRMLTIRNLSVTKKKTAGVTMKTLESSLALENGNAEKSGKVRCLDIDLPALDPNMCSAPPSQQNVRK